MISRLVRAVVLVVVCLATICGSCGAAEFVADFVVTAWGRTSTHKIYIKGKYLRIDYLKNGRVTKTCLMESGNIKVFSYDPSLKTYWQEPQSLFCDVLDEKYNCEIADKKIIGEETINGYDCQKIDYTFYDRAEGSETRWYSPKLKLSIKYIEFHPGFSVAIEYKNIKPTKLPDTTFMIPGGYTNEPPGQRQET